MPNNFLPQELTAIPRVLSAPRFATYLSFKRNDIQSALQLYQWNAEVSAAFLFPIHIFEICIRNAAANAIESFYNQQWPWVNAFERSLPDPNRPIFSPRAELISARSRHATVGKIIADIRFAFWVSIYTSRHQKRLWDSSFQHEFPNLPAGMTIKLARQKVYQVSDSVRTLRNRIAHHEPIFTRTLADDYKAILEVVSFRCALTSVWMDNVQKVTAILPTRP